jgi:hypothetical protein
MPISKGAAWSAYTAVRGRAIIVTREPSSEID